MRAVFLDIDGCLSPFGRRNASVLDAACVERVRRLHRHARIVLSSSWPVERARELGIPFDDALLDEERQAPERARLRGIARYLREHQAIKHWVSIDDDRQVGWLQRIVAWHDQDEGWALSLLGQSDRFLLCDWTFLHPFDAPKGHGLTDELYDRAVRLLRPELGLEIDRTVAAMATREARLAEMRSVARGGCCATCVFGGHYTVLAERQERAGANLARLLRLRGGSAAMGVWAPRRSDRGV